MRTYLYIFCALIAYLLLSSRSCVTDRDNPEKEKIDILAEKKRVKDGFSINHLDNNKLEAFENKAIQNLNELEDLLNIYFDTSMDSAFRQQAVKMTKKLFYENSFAEILNFLRIKSGSMQPDKIILDSIRISRHFKSITDETYSGSIAFTKQLIHFSQDLISPSHETVNMEIILTKTPKQLGSDTLMVWKVYFGQSVDQ